MAIFQDLSDNGRTKSWIIGGHHQPAMVYHHEMKWSWKYMTIIGPPHNPSKSWMTYNAIKNLILLVQGLGFALQAGTGRLWASLGPPIPWKFDWLIDNSSQTYNSKPNVSAVWCHHFFLSKSISKGDCRIHAPWYLLNTSHQIRILVGYNGSGTKPRYPCEHPCIACKWMFIQI